MEFCTSDLIHCHDDLILALMLNPIHGNFKNPRAWEFKGKVRASDYGLKLGVKRGTTIREVPVPEITTVQRAAFGILCSLEVPQSKAYKKWAQDWLSGKDRSAAAAYAAADAARAAADAARVAADAAKQELDLVALAHKAMEVVPS